MHSMTEMFAKTIQELQNFTLQWNDFLVDYSKNIINQETMNLLLELANEAAVKRCNC